MSKFLTLSFFLHAIAAAVVMFGVPAFQLASKNRISVAVILDAPAGQTNSVSKKSLVPRAGPRLAHVTPPIPPSPPKEEVKSDHYHADSTDPNAVTESPEAHKASSPSGADEDAATHTHGALDENSAYVKWVIEIVTKAKRYPKVSQDREEEGLVILAVALNSDGSVNDVRVEQTCPFERLNRAAVDTVRGIAKFPPPPGVSPAGVVTLHLPIRYKLVRR